MKASISLINNQKGNGLFIFILILATVGLVSSANAITRGQLLGELGLTISRNEEGMQTQKELELIFSTPSLCQSITTLVNGVTEFSLGAVMQSGMIFGIGSKKRSVAAMQITDVANFGVTGAKVANFNVTTIFNNGIINGLRNSSVKVVYREDGAGGLAECRLFVDPKSACEKYGATWIEAENRCGICEMLGGAWVSPRCVLPPAGP
jgi:hypothetical protein